MSPEMRVAASVSHSFCEISKSSLNTNDNNGLKRDGQTWFLEQIDMQEHIPNQKDSTDPEHNRREFPNLRISPLKGGTLVMYRENISTGGNLPRNPVTGFRGCPRTDRDICRTTYSACTAGT